MTSDPSIILFGKKIGLPESPKISNLPPEKRPDDHTPHDQRKDVGKPEEEEDDDNPKTPSIDEEESSMSENPTVGTLKKPDKILPCPRCESTNTKFCYYNNSNINQPRHFCKSCQRYWTAGGTMRNMPVGAGRRKKKTTPSHSHCRFIITQEAFESAGSRIEFAAADSDSSPKVLSFAPNTTPRLESSGNDCLVTATSNIPHQLHWIPYNNNNNNNNPWNTIVPMPIPPMGYHPPMPIYHSPPPPYWSSVSWLPPTVGPILGKHSRDSEPKQQRNSVLTPKTLRIDDPDEAAKSSIWATLGIDQGNATKSDLFKAFQAKGEEKKKQTPTQPCPALQANPAAFSRSLCFQERA